MIGLATLALLFPSAQVEGFEAVLAELDAGRFLAAESALESETDPLRRAWGEVEIAFRSREFNGAYARSADALAAFPNDARLHLRAAGSLVWLERTALAGRQVEALGECVQNMAPADREAWQPTVQSLEAEVTRLEERESSVASVLGRARTTVATLGLLFASAFLWLLRGLR